MTEVDFKLIPVNTEDKLFYIRRAFKYLNKQKHASVILDDQKSFEAIYFLKHIFNNDEAFINQNDNWKLFEKTKFDQLLINLFLHLSEICDEFKIDQELKLNLPNERLNVDADPNERKISILHYLTVIVNRFADLQFKDQILFDFNKRLFNNKIVEVLLQFFHHDVFLSKRCESYDPQDQIIGIIATFRNFSENPYYDKSIWKNSNIEKILSSFSKKSSYKETYAEIVRSIASNLNQKSVEGCLKNLIKLEHPEQIIESEEVYNDLFFIKFIIKKAIFKEWELFKQYDCKSIFEKLFAYFYKIKDKLNFEKSKIHSKTTVDKAELNDRKLSVLYYLLVIQNELVFRSIELNIYFREISLVKSLVMFLNKDFFKKFSENKKIILLLIIKNLSILSRWTDEVKSEWNDLNLVDKLLGLIETFIKKDEIEYKDVIISAYYSIGNIAEDRQIESLPQLGYVIYILLEEMVQIAEHLKENKYLKKVETQLINDDNEIETFQVSYLSRGLTGTLYGLTRFSVNQNSKDTIFEKFEAIKTIIYKGNQIEVIWSLKLVAQLCFSDDISNKILTDSDFCKYIQELFQNSKSSEIKKVTQTIIWSLNSKIIDQERNKQYVVLSYNTSCKFLCFKIKDELEKCGIDAWLDLDKLNGQSIETTALAIEKSKCVLICVSEKYRLSEQNQAQAKIATKVGKPIIALIMQDGYENVSGWLGNLIGDKVKINFVKSEFKDSMEQLINNLKTYVKITPAENQKEEEEKVKDDAELWSQEQVSKWFKEAKIHPSIVKLYDKIDGFTLKQIYNLKTVTPEFFYQTFSSELKKKARQTILPILVESLIPYLNPHEYKFLVLEINYLSQF